MITQHNSQTAPSKPKEPIKMFNLNIAALPSLLFAQSNQTGGVTVKAVVREGIEPVKPLTATIYQIPTTDRLSIIAIGIGLIAFAWLLLKRRNNLLVIDRYSQEPIGNIRIQIVEDDTVIYSTITDSKGKCFVPKLAKLPTIMLTLNKVDSFLIISKPTKPITILEI